MPPARRPRATSAAVSRTVTYDDAANEAFSATMGGGGGSPSRLTMSEEDYLQSQLKEVLRRQAEVDEAHQRGIIGFRHTLRQYYGSNAVLRQIISVAEKRRRDVSSSSRADGPATVTAAECEYLSQRSSLAVRRRNRVLHDVRVLEQSMEDEERLRRRDGSARHNSVADGRRAAEGEFVSGNRSVFLRVQKMERRLNEVLGMQRAVGVVLKGYQHNLDELEHDGTRYDVWMQLLEKEYGERHRDHVQLVHLYLNAVRDIQRAAADKELRLQQQRQVRVTKEKALAEKRLSVTHVLRETQRQEQRIVDLQHQLDEEAQLLESAEAIQLVLEKKRLRSRNATAIMNEDPLSATASSATELAKQAARLLEQDNLAGQTAEEEEKLAAYEKSFREMMKAAQVSRLDELADVFRSETVHQQQLLELVQERRVEHARLEQQVKSLRAEMSLLRCCGTTQPPTTSHALEDELRVFVREAHDELRQTTTTGEAKNVLVDDLLRGVNMLAAKLSAYRAEVAIPPLSRVDQDAPAIQHAVSMLTHKLIALADDATRRTSGQYKSGLQPPQTVKTTQIVLPENNTRIHISSGAGGVGGSGARQVANISSLAGKHLLNQRDQQRVMCASAMDDADSHDGTTSMGMGSTTRRSPSALTGLGAPSRRRVLLEDLLLLENGSDADSYNSSAEEDGSEAGTLGPSTRPTSASAASNVTASMAKSANRSRVGGRGGGGGGGASRRPVVVNSSDDPLQREEVKHMSALMETRERRRREKELRRRSEA